MCIIKQFLKELYFPDDIIDIIIEYNNYEVALLSIYFYISNTNKSFIYILKNDDMYLFEYMDNNKLVNMVYFIYNLNSYNISRIIYYVYINYLQRFNIKITDIKYIVDNNQNKYIIKCNFSNYFLVCLYDCKECVDTHINTIQNLLPKIKNCNIL